jgi:excisionase family DNA binding protein
MCAQVHEYQPLLTLDEAARRLSYSPAHVRRLVGSRGLPAIQIGPGAALRFDPAELDAWLEQRRKTTFEMSTVGSGSLAEKSALGHGSSVGGPAAHVRDPEASGSRARAQRAGEER